MNPNTHWDSFDKSVVYHLYDSTLCPDQHVSSPKHYHVRVGHKLRRP